MTGKPVPAQPLTGKPAARKLLSWTLGCTALLLAACSQTPAPAPENGALPPGSPYANGQQYPWSDRLDAAGADPYAAGRSYPWSSPTAASALGAGGLGLDAQGLNNGQNFLSDLPWTSATNGWGPVERNRSNGEQGAGDGTGLKVGGRVFAKGLGVHANSEIKYALGGQCNSFSAFVGVDEEVGKRGSVRFRVYGDGKQLFDSGVRRGSDLSLPVDVSVVGVKELRLWVGDGGDNINYDHAVWGDASVNCAAAQPKGDVFLSNLTYAAASSGWGPVEFDRSNGEQAQFDGRPLTIGGQTFAKGLGVHAFSVLSYDLGGKCSAFSAKLGLDDEVGNRGSVVFQVYGDDKKLYDSGVLRGSDPARSPVVQIGGVKALKLIVTDAGDNIDYDHADWADARLECAPAATGKAGTLDPSFGGGGRVAVGGVDVVAEDGGAVAVLDANFKVTRLSGAGAVLGQSAALPGGAASAITRQADGKLVVVGQLDNEMAAVRYLPNLTLDPSFGAGGVVRLKLSETGDVGSGRTGSGANDVVIQPDGKIVLAGYAQRLYTGAYAPANVLVTSSDLALVRLKTGGETDAGFGANGVTITSLDNNPMFNPERHVADEQVYGLALQTDGKLVVVGESDVDSSQSAVLGRYLPAGQLDQSFGQSGLVGAGGYETFRTVALQPDGKIVVGGGVERFFTSALLQIFSANGTGGPSATFRFKASENPNDYQNVVTTLVPQSDGSLIVGGYGDDETYIARFSSTLTQDVAFGGALGGNVPVSAGRTISLISSSDGKIVATTARLTIEGAQGQSTVRLFR